MDIVLNSTLASSSSYFIPNNFFLSLFLSHSPLLLFLSIRRIFFYFHQHHHHHHELRLIVPPMFITLHDWTIQSSVCILKWVKSELDHRQCSRPIVNFVKINSDFYTQFSLITIALLHVVHWTIVKWLTAVTVDSCEIIKILGKLTIIAILTKIRFCRLFVNGQRKVSRFMQKWSNDRRKARSAKKKVVSD